MSIDTLIISYMVRLSGILDDNALNTCLSPLNRHVQNSNLTSILSHSTQEMHRKTYWLFLCLGFSTYLILFCVIAQANYIRYFYASQALTILNIVYGIAEMLGGFLVIPLSKKWNAQTFTICHFTCTLSCLVLIVPLKFMGSKTIMLVTTSLLLGVTGIVNSAFFAILFSMSARLDPIYAQASYLGVGISSVVIQVVEDLISVFIPSDPLSKDYSKQLLINAISYFGGSSLLIIGCIPCWLVLVKLYPSTANTKLNQQERTVTKTHEQAESLTVAELSESTTSTQNSVMGLIDNEKHNTIQNVIVSKKTVIKRVIWLSTALGVSQAILTVAFPLFVMQIPCYYSIYRNGNIWLPDWWSLVLISTHMLFDLIGRLLPLNKWVVKKITSNFVQALCYSRLLFLVWFCISVFPLPSVVDAKVVQVPFLASDTLTLIILPLFSFSGAFCSTIGLVKYQDLLDNEDERSKGSFYVNLFMEIGIFVGGILSIGLIPLFP